MKKLITKYIVISVTILMSVVFYQCNREQKCEDSKFFFSGIVKDINGKPLEDVLISMQESEVKSDKAGLFKITCLKDTAVYVLNASKLNYGFVSKVYYNLKTDASIVMADAKVVQIDLGTVVGDSITIINTKPAMSIPLSASYSEIVTPLSSVPFVHNQFGQLIGFEMPPALDNTYSAISNFKPPLLGAQVVVPKKGLALNNDGKEISASIQTVDLYSPDGMPGDYSVRLPKGGKGFMRTYGAVNFSIFQDGKEVQLRDGYEAKIIVPVDTLSILTKEILSERIPFLVYDRKTGEWYQDGIATLNKTKTAYEAHTKHFSSFNMDMVFGAGSACYKVCNEISTTTYTNQKMEISVPSKSKLLNIDLPCGTQGNCTSFGAGTGGAHAIINLAPDTPVGVRMFNGTTLLSTYVFVAGAAVGTQDCSTSYDVCGGPVVTTNTFDQTFVLSSKLGMCHAQLASPVKRSDDASTPFSLELSWLYQDNFTSPTSTGFDIQISNDETFTTPTSSTEPTSIKLIHSHTFSNAIAAGQTKYFRVKPTASTVWSNVVCISLDAMGNATAPCISAIVPADCM